MQHGRGKWLQFVIATVASFARDPELYHCLNANQAYGIITYYTNNKSGRDLAGDPVYGQKAILAQYGA